MEIIESLINEHFFICTIQCEMTFKMKQQKYTIVKRKLLFYNYTVGIVLLI